MVKKILEQIRGIKKVESTLSDWEKNFIKDIAERAEKYGETLHVSEKQSAMIGKIFDQRVNGIDDRKPAKVEASSTENPFPVSDEIPA